MAITSVFFRCNVFGSPTLYSFKCGYISLFKYRHHTLHDGSCSVCFNYRCFCLVYIQYSVITQSFRTGFICQVTNKQTLSLVNILYLFYSKKTVRIIFLSMLRFNVYIYIYSCGLQVSFLFNIHN